MVFVKICGLREAEHVDAALDAGADAVGLVLTPSPRFIDPVAARKLVARVDDRAWTVGVFRSEPAAEVERLATDSGVSCIQLHGDYTRDDIVGLSTLGLPVIRAVPYAASIYPLDADMLLVDAPRAGSGVEWDYTVMAERGMTRRWLLAGGLTPANVASAIAVATPWGVDVSSGVETAPGLKDSGLIREFLAAARS
jgi:phosphoribosylanthranilate isomerase